MATYDVASNICITCHVIDMHFEPLSVESNGIL